MTNNEEVSTPVRFVGSLVISLLPPKQIPATLPELEWLELATKTGGKICRKSHGAGGGMCGIFLYNLILY